MGSRFKKSAGNSGNDTDQSYAEETRAEWSYVDQIQEDNERPVSDIEAELLNSVLANPEEVQPPIDDDQARVDALLSSFLENDNEPEISELTPQPEAHQRPPAQPEPEAQPQPEPTSEPEFDHNVEPELDYITADLMSMSAEFEFAEASPTETPVRAEELGFAPAEQLSPLQQEQFVGSHDFAVTDQISAPSELPDAAENLSYEGIEQGLLIIDAKRKRLWPLFVTGLVIFILLTATITYINRMIEADNAAAAAQSDQTTEALLDEAIALIQNADSVIVALDKASTATITEENIPRLESLIGEKENVLQSLSEAAAKAQQAKDKFISTEKKDLAQSAVKATELRGQMLEMSSSITVYDIAAMKGTLAIDYVLTMIIDADTEMRQAVTAVNNGGADAVAESLEANKRALEKLVLAEQTLAAVDTSLLQVDLKSITDYLAAKKASAELAVASDQAFENGDYGTYRAKTDEFNAKDVEAVALAANIPADPRSLIYNAYELVTAQLKVDYAAVRTAAADNDALLREYLGVVIEQAPAGEAPEGSEGQAPEGQTSEGQAPEGQTSEGQTTE
jgi:hypothetical protein